MEKHIKIGEMEIPLDYFKLSKDEKKEICDILIDSMMVLIDKHFNREVDRVEILKLIIDSSIITNENEENYEVCCVLSDLKKILDEPQI